MSVSATEFLSNLTYRTVEGPTDREVSNRLKTVSDATVLAVITELEDLLQIVNKEFRSRVATMIESSKG